MTRIARLATSACFLCGRASPTPGPATRERAIEHFQRFLKQKPDDLEVRWLLNLAYMMIGGYPDQVLARLPDSAGVILVCGRPRAVQGCRTACRTRCRRNGRRPHRGRFRRQRPLRRHHIQLRQLRPRCTTSATTATARSPNARRTAGLDGQLGGLNMMQTDYNNDGCKDILLLRGGWEVPQRKSLLRNNCDGTFTDVTAVSGLAQAGDELANGGMGRYQQRRPARPIRRQRRRSVTVVPEQGRDGVRGHLASGRRRSSGVHQRRVRGRLRQRRIRGLLRFEFQGRQLSLSEQSRQYVHRVWRDPRACPGPATVSRPGSSTTTTMDGRICSRRATSRRLTNRYGHTSASPTTPPD